MIMQRQSDGSYAQVGFVKTQNENIEQIVDANGDRYFTQGFDRTTTGYPLTLTESIGKPALDYTIWGNIQQNGTPTPEAPVEVVGCGDRTKNLLSYPYYSKSGTYNGVQFVVDNTQRVSFNGTTTAGTNFYFWLNRQLKAGTYTISLTDAITGLKLLVYDINNSNVIVNITKGFQTFTVPNDIAVHIYFNIGSIGVKCFGENIGVQLELGTEPTEYVPYGYEIPVVSRGKNLFDFKTVYTDTSKFQIDGESVSGNAGNFYVIKIKLSDLGLSIGDTFTFSATIQNNPAGVRGSAVAFINGKEVGGNYTLTTDPYISIVSATVETVDDKIYISYFSTGTLTASNIQLELGSTATEYEPYRAPITNPIYLPEPLYRDDYLTKDKSGGKAHRVWGVKVFDGTEKWSQGSFPPHTESYQFYTSKLSDLSDSGWPNAKNTHFINLKTVNGMSIGTYLNMYPSASLLPENATTDDFKSFLASEYAKGTPVTVYYPLAAPTEESIELPDISTFDSTTIIETDTELSPLSIEATYKAKKPVVYGYHINPNEPDSSNAVTYLEDAVGMTPAKMGADSFDYGSWKDAFFMPKPCMLKYDGTVAYYLDPNDYSRKLDGTPSDIANPDFEGNAMMEWPLIWYKFSGSTEDGEGYFYVSNYRVDDSYHCWCNYDANDNIISHFYTAIYNSTLHNGKFRSLSGLALTKENGSGYTTGEQEITYCTANNTTDTVEWYTDVYADRILINALCVLISKSLNTQSSFGRGLDTGSETTKNAYVTGKLNDKGLFYGVTANGNSAIKTFGMENWWSCVYHRTAGCISVERDYKVKLTYGMADGTTVNGYNSTGVGYISIGTTSAANGYIKKFKYSEKGYMPFEIGGSASTYYADYYYQNTGARYLLVGGSAIGGTYAGAFSFDLADIFTFSYWYASTDLSCKPLKSL